MKYIELCYDEHRLTAIAEALELLKGDVSKMYPANDLGLIKKKASVKKTALVKQKIVAIKPLPGHWEFVFDQAPAKKEVREACRLGINSYIREL